MSIYISMIILFSFLFSKIEFVNNRVFFFISICSLINLLETIKSSSKNILAVKILLVFLLILLLM